MRLILWDIDGTLANHDERADKYISEPRDPVTGKAKRLSENVNWDAYYSEIPNDPPYDHMVRICQMFDELWDAGEEQVFVTGRNEQYEDLTRAWLEKHVGMWTRNRRLIMRPRDLRSTNGDFKTDVINQLRTEGHDIWFAVDDDVHAAAAYRRAGIPCLEPQRTDYQQDVKDQ